MRKVALISEHASPLAILGGIDSGGQNVYVAHLALNLAQMGYSVDVFTRRESECQEEIFSWQPGV
jgi:D-inositol-3-phosphate glycosyltransferase